MLIYILDKKSVLAYFLKNMFQAIFLFMNHYTNIRSQCQLTSLENRNKLQTNIRHKTGKDTVIYPVGKISHQGQCTSNLRVIDNKAYLHVYSSNNSKEIIQDPWLSTSKLNQGLKAKKAHSIPISTGEKESDILTELTHLPSKIYISSEKTNSQILQIKKQQLCQEDSSSF